MEHPRPGADHEGMNTQTGQATGCRECGSPMIEVGMEMADGRVTFRMCVSCEARSWERQGVRISRQQAVQHPPRR